MKILIVKTGALGDVLRTTPLLRVLKGEIFWLTSEDALHILYGNKLLAKVLTVGQKEILKNLKFDLILNLEEDRELAIFITKYLNYKKIVGVFYDFRKLKLSYTKESSKWFDMSLISRFGLKRANELKFKNRKSYQEIVFKMLDLKFKGEEYCLPYKPKKVRRLSSKLYVALEKRAGKKWPMKKWPYYHFLKKSLEKKGHKVYFLKYEKNLKKYIDKINLCDILICGDTLGMHIGLALKKKIIAIFTCTSPWEIYDYGRMIKVVNPLLKQAFYKRNYDRKLISGIKVDKLIESFNKFIE